MSIALSTPVAIGPTRLHLTPETRVASFGSCFANEIASRMADSGLQVTQNPFGTLYNPASIAMTLNRMMAQEAITSADLVQHDGLWHSWLHHGSFSRPTRETCLEACHAALAEGHAALREADLLMVTFGTAYVFTLRQASGEDRVVANCHKLPPQTFHRRRMTAAEIVTLWDDTVAALLAFNPSLQILFTVSPIRHLADGAHGNQLSKATLLLATDQLLHNHPDRLHYFPSYEIILDELRDYRFFGPDMAHPTPLAADLVWQRFQETYFSPADRNQMHLNHKRQLRAQHIPLH